MQFLYSCGTYSGSNERPSDKNPAFIENLQKLVSEDPELALVVLDSLLQQIEYNDPKHTDLFQLLLVKASIFEKTGQYDSAFGYLRLVRSQAAIRKIPEIEAAAILPLYFYPENMEQLAHASAQLPNAIDYFISEGQPYEAGLVSTLMGEASLHKEQYKQAEDEIDHAIELLADSDSFPAIIRARLTKAMIARKKGNLPAAMNLYKEAGDLSIKITNKSQKANAQISLANFIAEYDLKQAYILLQDVVSEAIKANLPEIAGMACLSQASLQQENKEAANAEQSLLQAIRYMELNRSKVSLSEANSTLAEFYLNQKQYLAALPYLQKAYSLSPSRGKKGMLQREMIRVYEKTGNLKKAFDETKALLKQTDSNLALKNGDFSLEKNNVVTKRLSNLENELLRQNLRTERLKLLLLAIIFSLLIVSFAGVVYLFRQRTLILKERNLAYQVLLARYKNEKPATGHKPEPSVKTENQEQPQKENGQYNPILQALLAYFDNEAPYLDSKLKIEAVAKKLNTTQKNINQLLKDYDNLSFPYFINRYRVVAAMKMLEDPDKLNLKIEAIASDAGFGSKQSFYSSFENITGIKPTYYRSQMLAFNEQEENIETGKKNE